MEIGESCIIHGISYKLVTGNSCKDCCFNYLYAECYSMPSCDHNGHYERVETNIKIENNATSLVICSCDNPKYNLNEAKQELHCSCGASWLLSKSY
jgi:hypothetical protein